MNTPSNESKVFGLTAKEFNALPLAEQHELSLKFIVHLQGVIKALEEALNNSIDRERNLREMLRQLASSGSDSTSFEA